MKGPVKDAVEARFVAVDQGQLRSSGSPFEGFGEPHKTVVFRLVQSLVEERFFDGHAATLAPAGSDHILN